MLAFDAIPTDRYTFMDEGRYQVLPNQQPVCPEHPFRTLVARDLLGGGGLVVIKRLNMAALPSHEAWERAYNILCRETVLLQRISIPCTVKLLHTFSEGLQFNVVTQYIPGKTVEAHLGMCRRGPRYVRIYAEAEVIDFGIQIYSILSSLHALRPAVIHRDIKPGNIIRRPDGVYVLIDFGNARLYGSHRPLTNIDLWKSPLADTIQGIGSIGYAPPEQYPGWHERTYVHTTPISDLYGPAVCMHQMLTVKNPITKDQQKRFSFSSLEGYACPALVDLIGQLLQQETHRRPQSASEVVQRLQEIEWENWAREQIPYTTPSQTVLTR